MFSLRGVIIYQYITIQRLFGIFSPRISLKLLFSDFEKSKLNKLLQFSFKLGIVVLISFKYASKDSRSRSFEIGLKILIQSCITESGFSVFSSISFIEYEVISKPKLFVA